MSLNKRFLCTSVLATLVAFAPAIPSAAQTRPAAAVSAINVDLSQIRISNFGQINAAYYRGAQPKDQDYAALAALGVKTVLDLQQDGDANEARLVESAGMTFHRIPMTTHVPPTSEQLAFFLKLVNDPANQPVFVHCAGGRHRTGVMTAVYRITNDGWTADQAFEEMKRYKFGADFLHPEFKEYVYAYPSVLARSATSKAVVATKAGG